MKSNRQIIADALAHLNALGRTPREIADNLAKRKVKGDIGEGRGCVLARELQRASDEFACVEIGASGFLYIPPDSEDHQTPDLKPAVQEFMRRFDRGTYPELVKRYPRKRAKHVTAAVR